MADKKVLDRFEIIWNNSVKDKADVDAIASTAGPAVELKMEYETLSKDVLNYVDEQMLVASPILVPDKDIYRKDDDGYEYYVFFKEPAIDALQSEFSRKKYMKENQFNLEHQPGTIAPEFIKEEWLVRSDEHDNSETFGYTGDRKLQKGTWFGISKFTDKEYYQKIKEEEITGFSIEGLLAMVLRDSNFSFKAKIQEFKLKEQKMKQNKIELDKNCMRDFVLADGSIIKVDGWLDLENEVYAEDGITILPDGAYTLKETQTLNKSVTNFVIKDGKISNKDNTWQEETVELNNKNMNKKIIKLADYTLADGKTVITVDGDLKEGTIVYNADKTGASKGELTLEDGTVITIDENSAITSVVEKTKTEDGNKETADMEMEITPEIQAKFDAYDALFLDMQKQIDELKSGAVGDASSEDMPMDEQKMNKSELKFSYSKFNAEKELENTNRSKALAERLISIQKMNQEFPVNL